MPRASQGALFCKSTCLGALIPITGLTAITGPSRAAGKRELVGLSWGGGDTCCAAAVVWSWPRLSPSGAAGKGDVGFSGAAAACCGVTRTQVYGVQGGRGVRGLQGARGTWGCARCMGVHGVPGVRRGCSLPAEHRKKSPCSCDGAEMLLPCSCPAPRLGGCSRQHPQLLAGFPCRARLLLPAAAEPRFGQWK